MSEERAKVQRVSRVDAANSAVAAVAQGKKTTLMELAKQVDGVVTKSGGTTNLIGSTSAVRHALGLAEQFGLMKLTKPTDTIVERIK